MSVYELKGRTESQQFSSIVLCSVSKCYVSTVIHTWVKVGFLWRAMHSAICRVHIYKIPAHWLLLLCIRDYIPSRQICHSHNHWFVSVSPKELRWDELSVFRININFTYPAKVYWPSSPRKRFSCFVQVPCLHVQPRKWMSDRNMQFTVVQVHVVHMIAFNTQESLDHWKSTTAVNRIRIRNDSFG